MAESQATLSSLYFWLGKAAEGYVVLLDGNVITRPMADLAIGWIRRDLRIDPYIT